MLRSRTLPSSGPRCSEQPENHGDARRGRLDRDLVQLLERPRRLREQPSREPSLHGGPTYIAGGRRLMDRGHRAVLDLLPRRIGKGGL